MKLYAGLLAVLVGLCWMSAPSSATDGVSDAEVVALVDALEQARSTGAVTGFKSEGWDRLSAALLDAVNSRSSSNDGMSVLEDVRGGLFADLMMVHGKVVAQVLKNLGLPPDTDLGRLLDSDDGAVRSVGSCISALLNAQGLILEAMVVCQEGSAIECGAAIVRAAVAHAHAQSVCAQYLEQY